MNQQSKYKRAIAIYFSDTLTAFIAVVLLAIIILGIGAYLAITSQNYLVIVIAMLLPVLYVRNYILYFRSLRDIKAGKIRSKTVFITNVCDDRRHSMQRYGRIIDKYRHYKVTVSDGDEYLVCPMNEAEVDWGAKSFHAEITYCESTRLVLAFERAGHDLLELDGAAFYIKESRKPIRKERIPYSKRMLTIGLAVGILMSAVFLLLVPYSYGYLDKDKAVSVNGIFASFELNYDHNDPSRHIKGVSLNFEDIDRMFINYAWSDELIERLRTIEPGTRMELLIRPNSHDIMSIEADGKMILTYETSQEANLKQVRGFRWLGIFMLFCSGLFGWKLYKNISVV